MLTLMAKDPNEEGFIVALQPLGDKSVNKLLCVWKSETLMVVGNFPLV